MVENKSQSKWKPWLRPSRIIPTLTIWGAGTAIVLSFLKAINLSIAEEIVIALLALLAADALSERVNLLERLEAKLSKLSIGQTLRRRGETHFLEEYGGNASEICIIAVSGISLAMRHLSFFENRINDGCKIRIILLDPSCPSLQTWNLMMKVTTTASDIKSSLEVFKSLMQHAKGKCEIRLLNVFLPFSIVATDLAKDSGAMIIEYHAYKIGLGDRPHVLLTPRDIPYWFSFYREQFERAWIDAVSWVG